MLSLLVSRKVSRTVFLFLAIPLVLSAFTHLWNPIGFPAIHPDEGTYLRRAMYMIEYLSPQDPSSRFDHSQVSTSSYDHPYFGQLFLAGVFRLIGYPGLLDPKPGDAIHSIEMLYFIPRVLMGLLAVVDTFLIYKIAEVRYNRKVAFIASILFAVMPITWITRRIVLDSILMPFLLSSILFAVYYNKNNNTITRKKDSKNNKNNIISLGNNDDGSNSSDDDNNKSKKNISLILLSGIFLGLAIFTKIPAFTMIPLVGYLIIFTNHNNNNSSNKKNIDIDNSTTIGGRIKRRIIIITTNVSNLNLKALGLWFIPVILIPAIWPAYAIYIGQFDSWVDGVIWQASERQAEGKTFLDLINIFFRNDPALLVIGLAGLIFAVAVKRDLFLLLWAIPFIILLYLVGWVNHFHLIPLLPVFCISIATLIIDLSSQRIKNNNNNSSSKYNNNNNNNKKWIQERLLPFVIISAIGIFGLVSTIMIITINISSPQFQAAAFVAKDTNTTNNNYFDKNSKNENGDDDNTTIISSPIYSWIFKYAFHKENVFSHIRDSSIPIVRTEKVLLIKDSIYQYVLSRQGGEDEKQIERLNSLDKTTNVIANFRDNTLMYDTDRYPYTNIVEAKIGTREIDVQANY